MLSTHIMLQSFLLTLGDTRLRAHPFVDFSSKKVTKERGSKIYLQSILSQVATHRGMGGKEPAGRWLWPGAGAAGRSDSQREALEAAGVR